MSKIAGHTFFNGRCAECGRLWLDIRHCDETYIGESGYAHSGTLNAAEVSQIQAEREREDKAYELAMSLVDPARRRDF
jgi:hypothetical protein